MFDDLDSLTMICLVFADGKEGKKEIITRITIIMILNNNTPYLVMLNYSKSLQVPGCGWTGDDNVYFVLLVVLLCFLPRGKKARKALVSYAIRNPTK